MKRGNLWQLDTHSRTVGRGTQEAQRNHGLKSRITVRFEVLTSVTMKSNIFWDVTQCILVQAYWRFGVTYLLGRAITQAISRWLPTVAARVRARIWYCGICGGQSGTGAGFLRILRFPLPIFFPSIAPQSPSSIIWGLCNRPKVAAVPSGLSPTPLKKHTYFRPLCYLGRHVLRPIKIEAVTSSEISVNFYKNGRRHIFTVGTIKTSDPTIEIHVQW
jgi:hypothetical protein